MLKVSSATALPGGVTLASFVLLAGIVAGSLLGHFIPTTGEWLNHGVDYTMLLLVGLLFFGVRCSALVQVGQRLDNVRFIAIALLANFVLVPLIGYLLASLFLWAHPLLMVGLVIYFMSPCTDWFLSFTRLSGGNVTLGTVLIPINITLQLLLYPLYLWIFTAHAVQVDAITIGNTLVQWFLLPLILALVTRQLLRYLLRADWFGYVMDKADQAIPWVIALLVLQLFAGNIATLMEHLTVFVWVLPAVFTFFLLTGLLGEGLTRLFRLRYPEQALLTMTIAARNAPLMLAVTMAVLPDQPLIYSALVIGMLVEFPHLVALRHLLIRTHRRLLPASPSAIRSPSLRNSPRR